MINISVNKVPRSVRGKEDTSLLWVLRDKLKLSGTKFGCGAGLCGACTIHVNGEPVRSCQTTLGDVEGKEITTIEGLAATESLENGKHPLQKAWVAEQVPQCGYCQSGQIMRAAGLLKKNNRPSRDEIKEFMNTNICRCGTYNRIVTAIEKASREG